LGALLGKLPLIIDFGGSWGRMPEEMLHIRELNTLLE